MKANSSFFKPKRINKSILSNDDVCRLLMSNYANVFPDENNNYPDVSLLCCGVNDTYRVRFNKENYIYRIYTHQWKALESILAEIRIINGLKENLNTAHYPINSTDGDWIMAIEMPEGIRYGVLLNYVNGVSPSCSVRLSYLMGEQLAQLHDALDQHPRESSLRNYDQNELVRKPLKVVKQFMQQCQINSTDRLQRCSDAILKLEPANLPPEAYGICHGDAQINNILLHQEHPEFIDFDLCGYGARTYDIATYFWKLELRQDLVQKKHQLQLAFLRGYEYVRTLSSLEKVSIPTFMAWRHAFWLGAQATLLPNLYGSLMMPQSYFDQHLGWLEQWAQTGHADCVRMIMTKIAPKQDLLALADLHEIWWQKQRGVLMHLLRKESSMFRYCLHYAHAQGDVDLVSDLISESNLNNKTTELIL